METPTPLESSVVHMLENSGNHGILDKHRLAVAFTGSEYSLVLEGGVTIFFAYTQIAQDVLSRMYAQVILPYDGFGWYQKADPQKLEAIRAETDTDLIC